MIVYVGALFSENYNPTNNDRSIPGFSQREFLNDEREREKMRFIIVSCRVVNETTFTDSFLLPMEGQFTLDHSMLADLHQWIDQIPLSKPKKRIERDFADGEQNPFIVLSIVFVMAGTLVAEVVRHYLPDLIDMHNYSSSSSSAQKKVNWTTLNKKVFSRIRFDLSEKMLTELCHGKTGQIELLLFNLKSKINEELQFREKMGQGQTSSARPSFLSSNHLNQMVNEKKSIPPPQRNPPSQCSTSLHPRSIFRRDYQELKEHYFQQQEQIEILQAKMRRFEHVLQLKHIRISDMPPSVIPSDRISKVNPVQAIKNKKQ